MKRTILYIITLILVTITAAPEAVAKRVREEPLRVEKITKFVMGAPILEVGLLVTSNLPKAFTLIPGTKVEVEGGAIEVELLEQVEVLPKTTREIILKLNLKADIITLLKIKNKPIIRVNVNVHYKIGKARKVRTLKFDRDVSTQTIEKYLNNLR